MTDKDGGGSMNTLQELLEQHKLFIITNEHACCGGVSGYVDGEPPEKECISYVYGHTDPRHFMCHEVERIVGPDDKGRYMCISDTGNCWTQGYEPDLIKRLTEYSKLI
jgi:hypothetical protein